MRGRGVGGGSNPVSEADFIYRSGNAPHVNKHSELIVFATMMRKTLAGGPPVCLIRGGNYPTWANSGRAATDRGPVSCR